MSVITILSKHITQLNLRIDKKTTCIKDIESTSVYLQSTGTFPIDTTKTRLQIQGQAIDPRHVQLRYTGMVDCFVKISQQEGIPALYRGYVYSNFGWPSVGEVGLWG